MQRQLNGSYGYLGLKSTGCGVRDPFVLSEVGLAFGTGIHWIYQLERWRMSLHFGEPNLLGLESPTLFFR